MATAHDTQASTLDQPERGPAPDQFDDLDADLEHIDWLLRNLRSDDPIALLSADITGWLEAGGCGDITATWFGGEAWEVRFTPDECADEAQAERLLRHVARGCRCEIPQIMVIGLDHRFGAMLRLRPIPQPGPQ